MTALEPPSDRVILRPHDPETETAFGLALPEIAQGKSQYATVLAVGWGRDYPVQPGQMRGLHVEHGEHFRNGALDFLKVDDVVVMPAFNGTEIDWPGEGTVISILASELLAVVT